MHRRTALATAIFAVSVAMVTSACTSSADSTSSSGPVTLTYALWDQTQQAGYQSCADAFTAKNPNIKIKITQAAWGQYWQNLTTQMTAGDAPDVFTDHVAYYPQLVANNQIMDISSNVAKDKVDLSQYQPGLTDLWVKDGKRYGLPMDWDTIGIVYNAAMLKTANIDPATLDSLTWNPADGGTFEQLIAKLTVDDHGNNGLSPNFDKKHVKIYGINLTYDDGSTGQSGWGNLAAANGFTFLTDKNPFGTKYDYDSPALAQTIQWYASLAQKGYAAAYSKSSTLGPQAVLDAGQAAMTITGSWTVSGFTGPTAKQDYNFAPLPTGPAGRKSFINDLSDAIWQGTKHPQQAWQWVEFLASPACQDVVATKGVIFPAITEATKSAEAARIAAGQNITPFVQEAEAAGGTLIYPISNHADEVTQEVQTDLESVWLGQSTAQDALRKAQTAVDGFMSQP